MITNPKECDFEYLNAFSLPVDGKVLMIPNELDHDIVLLDLPTMICERINNQEAIIRRYADKEIMPGTQLEFQGKKYELLGWYGGYVLHQNRYAEKIEVANARIPWGGKDVNKLQFTVTADEMKKTSKGFHIFVTYTYERRKLLEFQWDCGVWDLVTFSPDHNYILLGNGIGLNIFKRD